MTLHVDSTGVSLQYMSVMLASAAAGVLVDRLGRARRQLQSSGRAGVEGVLVVGSPGSSSSSKQLFVVVVALQHNSREGDRFCTALGHQAGMELVSSA